MDLYKYIKKFNRKLLIIFALNLKTKLKTTFDIEGMTCTGCARTIKNHLDSIGCSEVNVNNGLGEATAVLPAGITDNEVAKTLSKIGYPSKVHISGSTGLKEKKWSQLQVYLLVSAIFTLPLLLHMLFPKESLFNQPIFQLCLCIPVFIIGIIQFGRSAWFSIIKKSANMDVLIFMGSAAAFIYSLYGTISYYGTDLAHHYLFYETSASIITLVLLGNLMEERAIKKTTSALKDLEQLQVSIATLITSNNQTQVIDAIDILPGNMLLVKEGEKVPTDGIILEGNGMFDESFLTGESIPIQKLENEQVIAGSLLINGTLKIRAINTIKNNTISSIQNLVKEAQTKQPTIQRLGDQVSSVFVPVVIGIALLTFLASWQYASLSIQDALISSIAVLVISCPCAMGLATPTAVMVGIGKAAKKGIIIKGGDTLESLANAKTVIFDKTGTLTTGSFKIKKMSVLKETKDKVNSIIKSLELNSNHPIAISLVKSLEKATLTSLKNVKEFRGTGISGIDENKNTWSFGSSRLLKNKESNADLVLLKEDDLIAELWIEDDIKAEALDLISWLQSSGLKVIMLSGDKLEKCIHVAEKLGITDFHGEKLPADKLNFIHEISKEGIVVMIGDGINDAPSLTQAHVGISFGKATDIAQNAAEVVLIENENLIKIQEVFKTSRLTLTTIKQNLFWALFYNVLAIPIAAFGFLSPIIAAGSMAFSDLIVIGNSIRLKFK